MGTKKYNDYEMVNGAIVNALHEENEALQLDVMGKVEKIMTILSELLEVLKDADTGRDGHRHPTFSGTDKKFLEQLSRDLNGLINEVGD